MESFGVYLLGAFIAGFSMCLLNTVVNPMLNSLGEESNKGNQLIATYSVTDGKVTLKSTDKEKTVEVTNTNGREGTVVAKTVEKIWVNGPKPSVTIELWRTNNADGADKIDKKVDRGRPHRAAPDPLTPPPGRALRWGRALRRRSPPSPPAWNLPPFAPPSADSVVDPGQRSAARSSTVLVSTDRSRRR